jgi:hypothetical protein
MFKNLSTSMTPLIMLIRATIRPMACMAYLNGQSNGRVISLGLEKKQKSYCSYVMLCHISAISNKKCLIIMAVSLRNVPSKLLCQVVLNNSDSFLKF